MKLVNDSVHGSIILPDACMKIMDTPQFQRLRDIKQMGTTAFVYPGGSYTRFEHSVGTCYLAGEYGSRLRKACPLITDKDILCLQLAGLCHDLGHGPFSHLWEHFMARMGNTTWKHEEMSLMMLDHLLDSNNLRPHITLEDGTVLSPLDWVFVKELIWGGPLPNGPHCNKEQFFYEIVSNKLTGIDVDKWDYILRDGLHLNIRSSFEYQRVIEFSRILPVDNQLRIAYRDKEMFSLYELFMVRERLHRKAYQHRVCKVIDEMFIDAFQLADETIKITLDDGTSYRMSECCSSPRAYERLSDYLFLQVLNGPPSPARSILQRIYKRDFYTYVGKFGLGKKWSKLSTSVYDLILAHCPSGLSKKDVIFSHCLFNYGRKEEDPLSNAYFFTKNNPDEAIQKKPEDGMSFPTSFEEQIVLVFVRSASNMEAATQMLESWKKAQEKIILNGHH